MTIMVASSQSMETTLMALPGWADPTLSAELAQIGAAGEGPNVEFKQDFPKHNHMLCKEVAAMATSGGGIILLGIQDNGVVSGLDGDTEAKRDELLHTTQNLIAIVQPRVKYTIDFGFDGGCVLGIFIADGQDEPVYYFDHRPYVREGRMSRPATPDEVKTRVWSHPSSEHRKQVQELTLKRVRDADLLANRQAEMLLEFGRTYLNSPEQ